MRVNIIYEGNNREYNNCVLLEREFVRRGYRAKVLNKTEDMIFSNEESITILPNSYRNEDVNHYRYVFNTGNNLLVLYPCEQVINHHLPLFYDYSDENAVKHMPNLCWGRDYYDFIEGLGYDNPYNKVVGAIQLDLCRPEFREIYLSKEEIGKRFGLPADKKWILFISDFVYKSDIIVSQIMKFGDSRKEELYAKKENDFRSCGAILKWFGTFLSAHSDYVIIYRKHPVEMITEDIEEFIKKYPDNFYCISELNIKEWIMNCEVVTTWNSTAVVECYAAKKNVQLLRPIDLTGDKWHTEYDIYKDYSKCDSYERFEESVLKNTDNYTPEVVDAINQYYDIQEKPAYQRIADHVEAIYAAMEKQKPDPSWTAKRWGYLLKTGYVFKLPVKKLVQCCHPVISRCFDLQKERKLALEDWIATARNKKKHKTFAKAIDSVICRNNR